jgi:hypothetical protein
MSMYAREEFTRHNAWLYYPTICVHCINSKGVFLEEIIKNSSFKSVKEIFDFICNPWGYIS